MNQLQEITSFVLRTNKYQRQSFFLKLTIQLLSVQKINNHPKEISTMTGKIIDGSC